MKSEKEALRKKYLSVRSEKQNKSLADKRISEFVLESEWYKSCDTVLCFVGTDSEVSTDAIIDFALKDGKKVAVPRCLDKYGNMSFHYIESLSQLEVGFFSIPEPPQTNPIYAQSERSLCLLPGICFDLTGGRLGYGKGYYDRFLDSFCGTTVGLCYEECLCRVLPQEDTDKKVKYIVTDERIYKI